jgi:O-antigen ligase
VFDNQYLLSLVETGVVGLVAFSGIFLTGIYAALRARFITHDPGERDLGLTLAAILVVPIIACATFDFGGFATANALGFVIAGAAGSLLRTAKSDQAILRSQIEISDQHKVADHGLSTSLPDVK